MPKRLTPIGRTNPKFRYLNRGESTPRQPAGAQSIVWSSCVIAEGGGAQRPKGGPPETRMQTAFGYTERGTKLLESASGLIAGGGLLLLTGYAAPVGMAFVTWGFVQAAFANTQYVQFSRPCSEKSETGF